LLKLNAVVGVTAFANADGTVKSMGIQCALCHSSVDFRFGSDDSQFATRRFSGTLFHQRDA